MRMIKNFLLLVIVAAVTACAPEPVANFTYSYTDNTVPAEVTFTNTSTDANNFRWDFGDGSTSNETDPVHTYETSGTFNITLLAKGSGGDNSITKSIVIDQATSYMIYNQLSIFLYNVISFYWDGTNIFEEVDHGTLSPGGQSQEVFTNYTEINVYFETSDGSAYLSTYPWVLTKNARNNININADSYFTDVTEIKKGAETLEGVSRRLREIE